MSKYPQPRLWTPKFPEKYVGDHTNIVARSSWEIKFMNWCDNNTSIVRWNSEETRIPYICATDNRPHTYFVDFRIEVINKYKQQKTYIVEIKPECQTIPPIYKGKQTKRYLTESMTFLKNQSKWKAATNYARDRGWEFIVLTEKHLF